MMHVASFFFAMPWKMVLVFCNILEIEKNRISYFFLFIIKFWSINVTNNRKMLQLCFKYFVKISKMY